MNINNSKNNNFHIAKNILLDPFGIDENTINKAIGIIFSNKIDYADLYFQYALRESWSLEEGIVKTGNFSINHGVGIRSISGEKTAFSYSDSISLDSILKSSQIVRSIGNSNSSSYKKVYVPSVINNNLYNNSNFINSLSANDKVNLLEKIEKMAKGCNPLVSQVMASLAAEYEVIIVAASDGKIVADIRPLVRISITVISEKNGRREIGHSGGGGRTDFSFFSDEILSSYVDHAVKESINNLEAIPAPAGEMIVVLGNGWPGILLHEAVGHGLEGDFNRKGSSVFSGKIGERVANKGVTVIDNGSIPYKRGSLNIDDEGNETKSNILIEDGILCGYMQDIMNAKLMNSNITGNGRRESFAHIPLPRMTNTYMVSGSSTPEEIVSSVSNGIYAVNFAGGQVDITSGKFVFSTSEAYLIEKGKITTPIKGATLIGNGPEVMKQVSMIGNDSKLDSGVGMCGKDGQSVPVGVGMPTIKIDKLTVGGTTN
ncbi:TldD protein [Candidatus Kinetoplastibacterium desouzaii TCC079E]|uniref:TldD protein n=1 Tax=Candidatus Kinetoplastidibacterium desouzai TCC079E TaxID=1208919 RepID=M1LMG3_9PROT|nr:metalloprotease TldD [Candidatus Kinetoplastibacterium desouzaii]AGF46917.1 TldD protein [Candidatus Kinetoplastibacterium desouzaii TCC079E]